MSSNGTEYGSAETVPTTGSIRRPKTGGLATGRCRTRRRQDGPDHDHRQRDAPLRRPHGRRRRPSGDPAGCDHRADRPQRRRQDHAVQPPVRLRQAQQRHVVVRRHDALRHPGLQGRADGSGSHVPAHQGAVASDRAREHEARCDETARREVLDELHPGVLARAGHRDREQGARAPQALQARREGEGLRRLTVGRSAQAARDGPSPHERSHAGDAGRARWPASTRR